MRDRLNPVPHQVGAQVDASAIIGAHARKERHVFAHHGEVVARIVEVEDAFIIRVVVVIFWKQIHADGCPIDMCFCIFCQRRDAVK